MTVSHASVTDGLFCDTAALSVSNGQVWDGLFCEGVVAVAWRKIIRFTLRLDQSVGFTLARWYTRDNQPTL